ncbi:MAG: ester cyclase [Acidimicrobiia bacterium]
MSGDPGAVVRSYWERVWNEQDLDALDEVVAEHHLRHNAGGNLLRSRRAVREDMDRYLGALAEARVVIDEQAVSGDTVWTRLTLRAVYRESEEVVVLSWLHAARVVDGRIAEAWHLNAPVDWSARPEHRD